MLAAGLRRSSACDAAQRQRLRHARRSTTGDDDRSRHAPRRRRRHEPAPLSVRRHEHRHQRSTRRRRATTSTRSGRVFAADGQALPRFAAFENGIAPLIPTALRRTAPFLTHPVFNRHHSETGDAALPAQPRRQGPRARPLDDPARLLHDEAERDQRDDPDHLARVRATSIRSRRADQRAGYEALRRQLEAWLCEATGYAGVSLQPNAGSQGEYAGLLAIRAWHASRGEAQRNVCLIPESAHGTNPASAQMAGMQVVVTKCDAEGNVDLADLRGASASSTPTRLACVMITYPSTYGVFETRVQGAVRDRARARRPRVRRRRQHERAGRRRGAGRVRRRRQPPEPAQDLLHPARRRRPGRRPGLRRRRPRAVPARPRAAAASAAQRRRRRLGGAARQRRGAADQLDVHAHDGRRRPAHARPRPRSSAPTTSPRGWPTTTSCTSAATSPASRRRRRARMHPRPAAAEGGDRRQRRQGISAEDVAKRLIDYGFHAPTLSFPVAGTLMVEPTESESLDELDRFCDAMIAIRAEIAKVEAGAWPRDDNPLKARAAHRRGAARRRVAACLLARGRGLSAARRCATPSTGRRSAASTTSGATATCRARARRWRATRTERRTSVAATPACRAGIAPPPAAPAGHLASAGATAGRLWRTR